VSAPPKICVVGSSNIDLISRVPRLPKLGETIVGHSFHMGYGGKGANQAVMAARLGAQVTMVTKVGRDVFGEGTRRNYQEQGIPTTYIMDDERFSGVAPIFVDDSAQNFIVTVPGANLGLSPTDARNAASVIQSADVLICQLEVPVETTLEAFRVAKAKGVRTILNPAPAAPLPDELLRLTDLCVPNETEAEALTGQAVATAADAGKAAQALMKRGPATVIITLGDRGSLLAEARATELIPPVQVTAVDPTGAGDAYIGSLAVFLGEGRPMRDAVRRANAVAALSVTRVGTQVSFPTRSAADAFLAQHGIA
jgi:ribokinase